MKYDVVLYFAGVEHSHVHKYLSLHKKLSSKCKSLLLLSNTRWGISNDSLVSNYGQHLDDDIISVNDDEAVSILKSYQYRLGVFSSSFRKHNFGSINNRDILASKSRGIKTIQICEMPVMDFYYAGADIVSLVSPHFTGLSDRLFSCSNVIFSNALLWDDIDTCLPYKLTKNEFLDKYDLVDDKPIILWCPSSAHSHVDPKFGKRQQDVYRHVCSLDNVLIKLHPNEFRRHKTERLNNKWTYELYAENPVRVLEQIDTHWAMKYLDYVVAYQTSLGMHSALYRKPSIYVNVDEKNLLFAPGVQGCGLELWGDKFIWAGTSCKLEELQDVVNSGFSLSDDQYDEHLSKLLYNKDRTAIDIMSDQFLEIIKNET